MKGKTRFGSRMLAIFAVALSIVLAVPATPAYAWNSILNHEQFLYYSPTFWTNSQGAFNMYGYLNAEWGSFMKASNCDGYSDPGEIQVQAMATIGVYNFGDLYPYETIETGPFVANWNGSVADQVIESSTTGTIQQAAGFGKIGAVSWGQGQVTANDGRVYGLPTYYHLLITTIDGKYVAGPTVMSASEAQNKIWIPGSNNFVGNDGRTYGVPYIDDSGEFVVPDMLRVELDDGSFGYIPKDSMQQAATENAETQEELEAVSQRVLDLEAKALQSAYIQYYGVDALDYESALECMNIMRFDNGPAEAASIMEANTAIELAAAANDGVVSEAKARSLTELEESGEFAAGATNTVLGAEDIVISESDFKRILTLATPDLTISVPAFAEDGTTVVGHYSFVRI